MVSVPEIRESDAVLNVDRVVVRPGYEGPGATQDEPVVLHGTPGLDLAHGGFPQAAGPRTPV